MPSRDKLLALGFGFALNIDGMQKLLKITRFPMLYIKEARDSVIIFGFDKRISIGEMNDLLFELGYPIIE